MHVSGRPVRARIDRAAFRHNLDWVATRCHPARPLAVVKADAYGHGLVEMARMAVGFDLAVATAEEAAEIHQAGCKNRIWVLEGPFSSQCLALSQKHDMVWAIHSEWQLDLIAALPLQSPLSICLKLDTGMHRLGLDIASLAAIQARLVQMTQQVSVLAVMTHFANSDRLEDASVFAQITRFDAALTQHGLTQLPQSLANSGAVLAWPQTWRDWVRPGIILYGAAPDSASDMSALGLRAVMSLESQVMSLRWIKAGEAIGYGSRWTAQVDSLIAVVAGGYADGYPRHAEDDTPVLVNGLRMPLAGRVSMDMLMVDVTAIAQDVRVGDPVELWGSNLPVDEVARHAGTIGYELLTAVSPRVPKVYE